MKLRQFGRHPVLVSPLGLGCAKLSPFSGSFKFATVDRVINRALERGINFFDTADSYGAGWSERWLGRALNGKRGGVMIATKCGRPATVTGKVLSRLASGVRGLPRATMVRPDHLFSKAYIEAALTKSLQRLGTEYVDIYMLHSPPQEVLHAGVWVEVFSRLRNLGLIRYFGISARSAEDAATAIRDYNVDCIEVELNPCTAPSMGAVLGIARKHGTAVIARQVFGSGSLLDGVASCLNQMSISHARDQAAAALLQFASAIPDVTVTLAGMSTVDHVDANTSTPSLTTDLARQILEVARDFCPPGSRRRAGDDTTL